MIVDKKLSQGLERTEARANADFVETRARLEPESGAEWIEVGGAFAMFDGAESPLTQTFGLGIFEDATEEHLDRLENFFRERGAPVFHEVSPTADPSILSLLGERGYRPIELTTVMCRELQISADVTPQNGSPVSTRVIEEGEHELWARTSAAGWASEHAELADFMFNFGNVSAQCPGSFPYLAELESEPIATGMLAIFDEVCVLAGASTVPEARRKGAQGALLRDRLSFAAERGCTLAMMGAAPGSQSQRNAQKNGFQIAYTRIKWQLFD
ncbi:MAG: GNAT family N-acetyltransferase [Aridibacter famidurans]|nr:GNAT family N-acetyltransferase [Aridibacter famidurans]